VVRKILWASLALAPATILVDAVAHPGDVALFVLSAVSLVPLAWLIGDSTEHAAAHTGPRIGGLLNASFGNAPELIIALFAVHDALPDVVRGSLAGSIISNSLLVLGVTVIAGGDTKIDRLSLMTQLGLVVLAVVLFLIPAVPGFHGNPERHSLVVTSIPVSVVLLAAYLVVTTRGLRGQRQTAHETDEAWALSSALGVLAAATVVTAFISEILVHSLHAFADAAGLSEFFIAAVIVAIVGNAAEHGGAVVIAKRGNMPLATEIALSSSAQVGLLVVPVIMLLSLAFAHPLPLSFRWEELLGMAGASAFVAAVLADGRTRRYEGYVLVTAYAAVVVGFLIAGDR
jgi:Ca2+:H+ antiporter